MHQHEQLEVWKRSRALAVSLVRASRGSRTIIGGAAWAQIVRSAMSVPANIAEGARRDSAREFAHFLSIAIASAAELHTHLLIAGDAELMDAAYARQSTQESSEIRRMLTSLRVHILKSSRPRAK
ncbi:MAG: four helix bundle protein [Gemmatimonadaceae bacterium]|nr:four helix bundle protein [Gemmatimonadaceae bacterium]